MPDPTQQTVSRRGRRCRYRVVAAVAPPWTIFETHIALTMLVGSAAPRRDHLLAPLFENRVVRHVGVVSYGLYLLNVPVVSAVRGLLGAQASAPSVFGASTAGSVIVATLVYRWVESPFLALRGRLRGTGPLAGPRRRDFAGEPP